MYLVISAAAFITIGYFCIDWEKWKDFYPTIQFYIICNLMYNIIFFNHTLWAYSPRTSWLNHTYIDLVFSFIIIPIVIMIYLDHIPASFKLKILYGTGWIILFTVIEYLFQKTGLFIYDNGWEIMSSAIFNIIMITVLGIHFKRPLAGILLAIPIIAILLYFHHPAFQDMK
ncbi:CBO0543 family protein [Mesobacillus jeotgali]|uniref:CBO0543 family protein n=1 Tax=Mesobacillus jeotgali TaxID=129985 RepID=UPI0009A88472|nr:CBO0543 family protein [Mesobacillus jeotgali]